ncbi:NADP-dependent malic enzyme [Halofilum ochraceum]|uniref:NADP-dependent malic enzyme n=1 Tax=Halofilum ochraceum TaxID=1611323 RepID=UPI0008DA454A|nr:NADP-dependent malic enzyme [Halofilum ochraceum]
MTDHEENREEFDKQALIYHRMDPPGKLGVVATKPLANQRDLSLAYSPGVAAACRAIVDDPLEASTVTARANLVGVITNGSAVLGLGNIGALAAKPVMEGKAVLFKAFSNIDVFDIEVDQPDVDRFCDAVAALEPTFGGINLEDIKAPECFEIERRLGERMNIPVFHDDQHGTAICVAAATLNAMEVVGKKVEDLHIVCSGAGAAALACLDMLCSVGARKDHITVTDAKGVVRTDREDSMDQYKARYARETDAETLGEIIDGADLFLGLSAPGVLTAEMVKRMAANPLIFALANPVPEIWPEEAKAARDDVIMGTGRSDYPNQINNVLCFPFIFRGALDCGATEINDAMKVACAEAIAALAQKEATEAVASAYEDQSLTFGRDFLIPKPFDPRLILEIAPAVARAAMETGVAARPIQDFEAYNNRLQAFVYRSTMVMKPVFEKARQSPKRVVFADGEQERVLRAIQVVVDEQLGVPIVIGRREVVRRRINRLDLRLEMDTDFELCDPEDDPRYREYWTLYHQCMARKGVSPDTARTIVRTNNTVIAALMVKRGEADGMICGHTGIYQDHLRDVDDILGRRPRVSHLSGLTMLIMPKGTLFLADTHISPEPDPDALAEMAVLAARQMRRFGIEPKVAMLSHSNFGTSNAESAQRVRDAVALLRRDHPDLEIEGEMQGDAALDEQIRERLFPDAELKGAANLLIMPSLDAANIAYNLLKQTTDALSVGPILLGCDRPAHIVTPSVTARGIVNMTAIAVTDAQLQQEGPGIT